MADNPNYPAIPRKCHSDELTCDRFGFNIPNPALFTKPQWSRMPLPAFRLWKIVLAVYFIGWLAVDLYQFRNEFPLLRPDKWLVYLTHWTYLIFTAYLTISALNVCICAARSRFKLRPHNWALKLQWFLWNVGAPSTTAVVLIYWTLLWPAKYRTEGVPPTAVNVHVHLLNGIIIFMDQAVHAIPLHLLHMYQPITYGAAYVVFTGIYFAENGTDPYGRPMIYDFLDYENNRVPAIVMDVAVVLLVVPLIWMAFWYLFKLRTFLWTRFDPRARTSRETQTGTRSGNSSPGNIELYTITKAGTARC